MPPQLDHFAKGSSLRKYENPFLPYTESTHATPYMTIHHLAQYLVPLTYVMGLKYTYGTWRYGIHHELEKSPSTSLAYKSGDLSS